MLNHEHSNISLKIKKNMNIKSIVIFILVGSSFFFSNLVIRDSVQSFIDETEASSNLEQKYDKIEIVFWIFLLHIFGITGFIILKILENISKTQFLHDNISDLSNEKQIYYITI